MIFSRVWAKNRRLSCCSLTSAKHLLQYHQLSCWSNCDTGDSASRLSPGYSCTSVVARSVYSLGPHLPTIGITLYKAGSIAITVTSYLDYWYCSVVYQDASLCIKTWLLLWLFNRAIRYIFGIGGMTRIRPFRSKLGWLRTDSRMHYFALL